MGFWDDLYEGFAASQTETILLLTAFLLFVGALVAFFAVRSHREKKARLYAAHKTFKKHAENRNLTWHEQEALDALAKHLHAPERKHLLVVSQGMFNSCAGRALDENEITEEQVSALRVKLGFAGKQTDKPPKSTTELPAGAGVLIDEKDHEPVRARVREHRADFFEVQLDEDARDFALDRPVTVVYQTNSGMFAFDTEVRAHEGPVLRLAHSEKPQRLQRRRYYRRDVDMPVYVRNTGDEASPKLTHFLDVGGGGASIRNPNGEVKKGSDVELTFHPNSEERLNLHGRVVRTSRQGSVLHIKFERLRESARDKVYRVLFRR